MLDTTLLNWSGVEMMAIALFICLLLTLLISPVLDALSLGENTARTLGLPLDQLTPGVDWYSRSCNWMCCCSNWASSFVGLAAPHLVRKLSGGRQRVQLLFSCVGGGILLLSSDLIARTLFQLKFQLVL